MEDPRYIVYLHNQVAGGGSFEVCESESLADAKELLRGFARETYAYEQTSASLYPWSKEGWAEAREYAEIGCPFDYPSYLIEWGPRGGLKVEKC